MAKDSVTTFGTTMAMRLKSDSALKLTIIGGPAEEQEIILNKTAVAGSDPDTEFFIDDPLVCPRHLRFYKEGNWWIVKDMLSENGTFLNGKLVKTKPLFPNCRLQVGSTLIAVDYVDEPQVDTVVVKRGDEWVQLPAIIAHELKNYLQFLDAGLEQLKGDDDVARKFPGEIQSFTVAGERMQGLVQMLRSGCAEPNKSEVNIVDLVWEQIALIESAADAAGVILEVSLPDRSIPVVLDEYQMGRCILNLLKNALEACEKGNIIGVMVTHESQHHITLIIRDTGKGMSKQTLESMWTPMFTTRDTGNGLGAFIARTIVMKHGGRIIAESTPGKGTVIRIELPRNLKALP